MPWNRTAAVCYKLPVSIGKLIFSHVFFRLPSFLHVEANLIASITGTGFSSFLLDEFVLMLAIFSHDSKNRNPQRGTLGSVCLSRHPVTPSYKQSKSPGGISAFMLLWEGSNKQKWVIKDETALTKFWGSGTRLRQANPWEHCPASKVGHKAQKTTATQLPASMLSSHLCASAHKSQP